MKKIIVANWKMFGSIGSWNKYIEELRPFLSPQVHVVLCPPFPYLFSASQEGIDIGAQNCHEKLQGPFTGEVSAKMLRDVGCTYVIIGHSERRHHESDAQIVNKINSAREAGLVPILCVGETKQEREKNETRQVLERQLREHIPLQDIIVAYEPVWAIGTGVSADTADIVETHGFIKSLVPGRSILYGGSVNGSNAHSILSQHNVDGVLVGGASIEASQFGPIIQAGVAV